MVVSTTDTSFAADVLASSLPVLVDFAADWCPPCKIMEPVLAQFAAEQVARVRVVSLDVDENPVVADAYEVSSMPTLILFIQGRAVLRLVGVKPLAIVQAEIEPYLPSSPVDPL